MFLNIHGRYPNNIAKLQTYNISCKIIIIILQDYLVPGFVFCGTKYRAFQSGKNGQWQVYISPNSKWYLERYSKFNFF